MSTYKITPSLTLNASELELTAIRAQGAGGQNVNKVSSAVQLRFDIQQSSLPARYKENLLRLSDKRITKDGVIVIKAQRFRTQEQNKEDALQRLKDLIILAGLRKKQRKPTRPTRSSQKRRVDDKTQRGQTKILRKKVKFSE